MANKIVGMFETGDATLPYGRADRLPSPSFHVPSASSSPYMLFVLCHTWWSQGSAAPLHGRWASSRHAASLSSYEQRRPN